MISKQRATMKFKIQTKINRTVKLTSTIEDREAIKWLQKQGVCSNLRYMCRQQLIKE